MRSHTRNFSTLISRFNGQLKTRRHHGRELNNKIQQQLTTRSKWPMNTGPAFVQCDHNLGNGNDFRIFHDGQLP